MEEAKESEEEGAKDFGKESEEEGAKESEKEETKQSKEEAQAKDPPEDKEFIDWKWGTDAATKKTALPRPVFAKLPGAALPRPFALPRPVFDATEDESLAPSATALPRNATDADEDGDLDLVFGAALPRPNFDATEDSIVNQQKENLADEYVRLSLQFESALIQHKLALQYFEFRAFYFVFLPVTIIATLITIIGFLISGSGSGTTQDGEAAGGSVEFDPLLTGNLKQKWSLVVGILGAISTLLNGIGKRTNYQSQSDMHRSAVKALEKICLSVDFERDWFDRNVRNIEYAGYEELATKLGADLKTHQASFKAMIDACCDSPVPYQVVQAFTLLEQNVAQQVFGPDGRGRGRGRASDLSPLMFYYHKLWKEHTTYWLWPLKAPSIVYESS